MKYSERTYLAALAALAALRSKMSDAKERATVDFVAEAIAEKAGRDNNAGWISVKDRLPEEVGSYLVFYREWSDGAFLPTYEDCTIRVMRFLDSRKWCYPVCVDKRCEADTHRKVTHWMPLPEPPEGVQP